MRSAFSRAHTCSADIANDLQAAVAMEDFRAPLGENRIATIVGTLFRSFRDGHDQGSAVPIRMEEIIHRHACALERGRPGC